MLRFRRSRARSVSMTSIEACLLSGKYDAHIQEDIDNANATGGRGTPWSIVVGQNKISIVGRMAGGDNKTAY